MRKLASIKTISKIIPIEGRDRIELAIVDGWSVIVKKDEFKIGDKCVYCEIDSVMPETEQFEFLRSKSFRIKTMKMAGVISQGICFPMSILPSGKYDTEQDVTEILGIKKFERKTEIEESDKNASTTKYPKILMKMKWFRQLVYRFNHREGKCFPDFISKTDETRIQNIPWILSSRDSWIATEKIDGQSGTFAIVKHCPRLFTKRVRYEYIVCSRNLRLFNKDNSSYWSVSERYDIQSKLKRMMGTDQWIAIQGECIAPNVQGNKYNVSEPDLYVFNVITPRGRMGSIEARNRCVVQGFKFVPILETDYVLPDTVDELLKYAHGTSKINNSLREGIVFRSADGKRSFKAVDPLFLIEYDE